MKKNSELQLNPVDMQKILIKQWDYTIEMLKKELPLIAVQLDDHLIKSGKLSRHFFRAIGDARRPPPTFMSLREFQIKDPTYTFYVRLVETTDPRIGFVKPGVLTYDPSLENSLGGRFGASHEFQTFQFITLIEETMQMEIADASTLLYSYTFKGNKKAFHTFAIQLEADVSKAVFQAVQPLLLNKASYACVGGTASFSSMSGLTEIRMTHYKEALHLSQLLSSVVQNLKHIVEKYKDYNVTRLVIPSPKRSLFDSHLSHLSHKRLKLTHSES